MEQHMKVCLKVVKNGEKVSINGQMGQCMKEIGLIIILKGKEHINGLMVDST